MCAQTIDVTAYGAKADGSDSTAAIKRALAAATFGSEVYFPCGANGTGYRISQPINFPSHVTIVGSQGYGCQIVYQSTSYADAAFSLVNSTMVTIRDIGLYTMVGGVAPATILTVGGVRGLNGQHLLDNVSIGGYATKAMVYSITSENNVYKHLYFDFMGGGAAVGFYTSGNDDFGICSTCTSSSNLSLMMDNPIFAVAVSYPFTAIEDKTEGGTGDHVYRDGYIGAGQNPASSGFTFISGDANHAGPNSRIVVSGFRIENGGFGFTFRKDVQPAIYNLDISGITWDSSAPGAVGFMQSQTGLLLSNCRFVKNIGENHSPNSTSSLDQIQNSTVMEDYGVITIRSKASGNVFLMTGKGGVALPSGTSSSSNILIQPGS